MRIADDFAITRKQRKISNSVKILIVFGVSMRWANIEICTYRWFHWFAWFLLLNIIDCRTKRKSARSGRNHAKLKRNAPAEFAERLWTNNENLSVCGWDFVYGKSKNNYLSSKLSCRSPLRSWLQLQFDNFRRIFSDSCRRLGDVGYIIDWGWCALLSRFEFIHRSDELWRSDGLFDCFPVILTVIIGGSQRCTIVYDLILISSGLRQVKLKFADKPELFSDYLQLIVQALNQIAILPVIETMHFHTFAIAVAETQVCDRCPLWPLKTIDHLFSCNFLFFPIFAGIIWHGIRGT